MALPIDMILKNIKFSILTKAFDITRGVLGVKKGGCQLPLSVQLIYNAGLGNNFTSMWSCEMITRRFGNIAGRRSRIYPRS